MSDQLAAEGLYINSIVGEGTKFRGELELNGLLRIDGDFSGSIKTDGKILIGKNGRAQCSIEAETVVIAGVVHGSVQARSKVKLLSSALVIGTLIAPRLDVEEGVIIDGDCIIKKDLPIKKKKEALPRNNESLEPRYTDLQSVSSGNEKASDNEKDRMEEASGSPSTVSYSSHEVPPHEETRPKDLGTPDTEEKRYSIWKK